MQGLGRRDRLPIGPRFDEVESPQIIISGRDPEGDRLPNEEDIILSTQDGTLISYTEGWDGKQTEVIIELLDPDGIFISKIFSFYIDNLRAYFKNFSSVERSVGRDRQIIRFFRGEYAINQRVIGEKDLVGTIRNSDIPFTILEDENFAISAFEKAFNKLEKLYMETGEDMSSANKLQEALDTVGLNPEMFINVGYGHESGKNYSGFKKLTMKNIVLNQDSNREHTLTIKFVPNLLAESALDNDDPIVRTDSEKGTDGVFPTSTDKNEAPILLKARYTNDGKLADLPSTLTSKRPKEVFVNNTANIVFLIEDLLERYLIDNQGNRSVVMLSPAMELAIKKQTELVSLDPTASVALHNLSVKLAKCGIRIKVSQQEFRGEEKVITGTRFTGVGQRVENTVEIIKTIDYSYSLFLEVNENESRKDRVEDVIRLLYKEFQVYPNDISSRDVNNSGQVRAIFDQLYTKKRELEATSSEQILEALAPADPNSELGKVEAAATVYIKKGLNNSYRELNKPFEKLGNVLVIGDDYIIKGLMFPKDIAFTRGEYEQYSNYIKSNLAFLSNETIFTNLNCNAVRFIEGSRGQGLSKYLEKWTASQSSVAHQEMLIPDEYALRFLPNQLETILRTTLLFIAGSENSNVIEVTSEENNFAFAEYQSFFSIGNKKGIKSAREFFSYDYNKANYLYNLSDAQIEQIVGNVMRGIYGDTSLMRVLEEINQRPVDETQAAQDLKDMYRTIINEIKDSAQVKNKNIDPKALTNYLLYTQSLAQNARKLVIKTSPSFFIDDTTIKDPVIFFHKNPFITSSQSRISALSILNGLYQIIGYKHVINGSECYTEVVLLRNQLAETFAISSNITDIEG